MYITGLIHRDRLFEIACRWLADRYCEGDGRFVTEVFIFEKLISTPTGRRFLRDINASCHPGNFSTRRILFKDDLRNAVMAAKNPRTQRVQELFDRYEEHPDEYFPSTPADLIVTVSGQEELLGMVRFKRIKRIAEKASRRIADRLAGALQAEMHVETHAHGRPKSLDGAELSAEPGSRQATLADAERAVCSDFRGGGITFEPTDMRVDDLMGFKFVGTPQELEDIELAIRSHPQARVAEREIHHGHYNDVNLLVDLQLPSPGEIIDGLKGWEWSQASGRGLSPQHLAKALPDYVESGARTFRAEVILTTFDELVESEFGRSIHEERILEQRRRAPYSGRIAQNASFLIEYLLMLSISPTVEIQSLPVKMWGRYLPDVYARAVWRLFGSEPNTTLFDSILLDPEAP